MKLEIVDFNKPEIILETTHKKEWEQVRTALETMPLHLKASDQDGKQGSLIFDPVGTNAYIKKHLFPLGWKAADIEKEYGFLGINVDFAKSGVILEAQFSNYPFLLNNLIRSELFFREKLPFDKAPMSIVVIVVKARMLPASNSTLYYEQALNQLNGLAKYNLFSVPVRMLGLFSPIQKNLEATFTTYSAARYSRKIRSTHAILCEITQGSAGRCKIVKAD